MATVSMARDLKADNILVVSLHPGWVQTEMGGLKAPMKIKDCVKDICILMKHLEAKHNGQFLQHDGTILDW